ncbi:aminotransferase class I/II-fold pyridoxal phosphate-dependent enzyme [Coleofasciculus sp. E2-BRE-01]|uniref:aminotransferase class I/II-fold pyridoxal phosphate-dependent enzyme n=1 Tax=Coleofasciculus sp. E2-BRE-01 TaxID=3069524 RepID=UPI0032FE12EF
MTNDEGQRTIPILDALQACAGVPHAPFYAPGHKRGKGISDRLANLWGKSVFEHDLPELPDFDNLFAPSGGIKEAQALAAEAFGADKTWFLVNGSTCGVIAAILATCGTGDKLILPRNSHQSAIAGLVLSGASPIFITPDYDPSGDLAHSITPDAVSQALKEHPDAKAVMLLYPTYHGVCGDIHAIAQRVHDYNIPLLVDEAHGAHLTFHPDLPPSAMSAGADLTIQSTHKVLTAMTQASMLHIKGHRLDPERLSQALQLVQSTSPSALLLASLDAARQQMMLDGERLISRTLRLAEAAREQIQQIPGLSVLDATNTPGCFTLDPTRLTVRVMELGLSGFEADEIFCDQLGVIAELPTFQHLTFILSLGNTAADIQLLVQAFTDLQQRYSRPDTSFRQNLSQLGMTSGFILEPSMPPRDAFFAPKERLTLDQSVGHISAEWICPYPPGIPVLIPGCAIASTTVDYLRQVQHLGGYITGCSDPRLERVNVVKSKD